MPAFGSSSAASSAPTVRFLLRRLMDAASQELSSASDSVRAEHDAIILTLKRGLGVKLFISPDDLEDWRSSHPHWRHRIARVKQLLADMPLQAQDVRPADYSSTVEHIKQKLLKYQTSGDWPKALSYLRHAHANTEQLFERAQAMWMMSPADVAKLATNDASLECGMSSWSVAFGLCLLTTAWGAKVLKFLKSVRLNSFECLHSVVMNPFE